MGIFVSASALKDFIKCEEMANYRLFARGEPPPPSREQKLGIITHRILQKSWDNKAAAMKMRDTLCKKENIDAVGVQSITHFISIYFETFRFLINEKDEIEKRFKIKLYDDVYLVGVFDRVGKIVIDWKTDANPPRKIDNNVQFILYDLAYKKLYNKPAQGVYLAALKDGSFIKYNENKLFVNILMDEVVPKFVETVRNKSFVRNGVYNGSCYRCPYKQPCLGVKDVMVYPAVAEE